MNTVDPESVGFSPSRLERVKPAMQIYVDQDLFAGLSTLVSRKGKIVHFEQFGWMDKELKLPMTDDTIFRIYSMTKPIVCVALMTLYELGHFHLFDPVERFIPALSDLKVLEWDGTGGTREVDLARPITIRDLLTNTAGFTYDFWENSPVGEMYRQIKLENDATKTLEAMINELARLPLAYQPGTRWHYSVSIDVVGHLVEVISGQPLDHFLREKIFGPLGMIDTDFCVPPEKQDRLATIYGLPDLFAPDMTFSQHIQAWENGYNQRINVSTTNSVWQPGFARGGYGLFSTAWDYMRFAQMLLNGGELDDVRILGRKTTDLMHMNHLPADLLPYELGGWPSMDYGFGLGSRVLMNVAESELPGSVGEFGWSGAAKTYYWVDPQEELIGIMLTQKMMGFDVQEKDFQVLTYQALVD